MGKMKIRESVKIISKNGICYILGNNGKVKKYKPWLGDLFSFLYDRIMQKSVFPKKFNASIDEHYNILKKEFENIHNTRIIEFATGSGDAVKYLNNDNLYAGVDISAGLLRIARKRFDNYMFKGSGLYVADVSDTPFADGFFDIAFCNLSLNFFDDIDRFFSEIHRTLKPGGIFFCSVPVPERKTTKAVIHGNLYKAEDLKKRFERHGFSFKALPYDNGALFYFRTRRI
ncbi:MAG: class I SAM-dependent methyltransferase [Bacteroidota bacterium]